MHKRRTIGGTKPRAFERKESTQKEPMLLSKCMKKVHEQEIEKDQKRDTFAFITLQGKTKTKDLGNSIISRII